MPATWGAPCAPPSLNILRPLAELHAIREMDADLPRVRDTSHCRMQHIQLDAHLATLSDCA